MGMIVKQVFTWWAVRADFVERTLHVHEIDALVLSAARGPADGFVQRRIGAKAQGIPITSQDKVPTRFVWFFQGGKTAGQAEVQVRWLVVYLQGAAVAAQGRGLVACQPLRHTLFNEVF